MESAQEPLAVNLAPSLWQMGPRLILDVPELLQAVGLADTEGHRSAIVLALRLLVTGYQLHARTTQGPTSTGRPSWEGEPTPPKGT